jgi:hypothetical protein
LKQLYLHTVTLKQLYQHTVTLKQLYLHTVTLKQLYLHTHRKLDTCLCELNLLGIVHTTAS